MSKRSNNRVNLVRNGIIAFFVVLIAAVIGYGTLYSTGATQGEFVAGEHYQVLEQSERTRPNEPIMVTEYFSYACVHCRSFDPLIEEWRAEQPDDVAFRRDPVAFSAQWGILAAAYQTLVAVDALDDNHERIFRAIHDNGRAFNTPDSLAEFVDGFGTTKEAFLEALASPEVRRALRESDRRARTYGIASTPSLVVAGKYLVNMDHGRKVALEIVDHLVALERNERAGESAPAA